MSNLRSATVALATTGILALPAGAVATTTPDIYRKAADGQARRFLREIGPASSIAALPSGPCLVLDRRRAVCRIAVLIRVEVAADGSNEPWRCDAYVVVVVRHNGTTSSRRTSAVCRPSAVPPLG